MTKNVRRRVLIREKEWLSRLSRDAQNLYTSIDWQPLTRSELEKQNMWAKLQGEPEPWNIEFTWSRAYLHRCDVSLYNERYRNWIIFVDGEDQLWMKPDNSNGKPQRLGIATLEYTPD